MGIEDPLLEETLSSKNMKETIDESEETLSLCDLPLYSDQSTDWDQDLSITSNSTSSSHEDYFEFFSQELNPSTATTASAADFPPENIVFCGKLIPYKQLSPCKADSSNQAEIKIQANHTKKSCWQLKFSSTKNSKRQKSAQPKNGNKSTTALMHQSHKKMYNTNKLGKCRMAIFAAPPPSRKAKWYFLLFGISRFSPVVELRDIRSRQSRRRCRSPPPSSPPPMFGFRYGDDKVSDRRWGLWGLLIRALSCGGNHQPTTVAAGGGCAPPE